ncbi:MAG: cysteine desulfurase family protein [Candidatus Polarisedimenticolia bacterium]
MSPRRVYADHASTTPPAPEVLEAMLPFLGARFGNPGSLHSRGSAACRAVDEARARVAALIGCSPHEIVFTGSATESNNLAVKGTALAAPSDRRLILAAATEHISVLHPIRSLERQGFRFRLLPVDRQGLLDPAVLERALSPEVLLVSVAHASAEIGTLQPMTELCRIAHRASVPLHCDATATVGLAPPPAGGDAPDLISFAPHLFYGPQGIGALRVREGLRLAPLIEGGTQEGGLRAGTESLAAIAGFGAAARLAAAARRARSVRAAGLAGRLRNRLQRELSGAAFTGHPERRIPGHLSLCVPGAEAEALLEALDEAGIEAASGSPCTTAVRKPSHVLEAMGLDPVVARGALVFSFGETSGDHDPDRVAEALVPAVDRLRRLSPL